MNVTAHQNRSATVWDPFAVQAAMAKTVASEQHAADWLASNVPNLRTGP